MAKLTNFIGGLNNKLHPSKLSINEAEETLNISLCNGSIEPAKTTTVLGDVNTAHSDPFIIYNGNIVALDDANTCYLEHNNKLYSDSSNDFDTGITIYNSDTNNFEELGCNAPTTLKGSGRTPVVNTLQMSSKDFEYAEGSLVFYPTAGLYKYKIVIKDGDTVLNIMTISDYLGVDEENFNNYFTHRGQQTPGYVYTFFPGGYKHYTNVKIDFSLNSVKEYTLDNPDGYTIEVYRQRTLVTDQDYVESGYRLLTSGSDTTFKFHETNKNLDSAEELSTYGDLSGFYSYALTYEDDLGNESQPIFSDQIYTYDQIFLQFRRPYNSNYSKINIYRLGGYYTSYILLDTLELGVPDHYDIILNFNDTIEDGDYVKFTKQGYEYTRQLDSNGNIDAGSLTEFPTNDAEHHYADFRWYDSDDNLKGELPIISDTFKRQTCSHEYYGMYNSSENSAWIGILFYHRYTDTKLDSELIGNKLLLTTDKFLPPTNSEGLLVAYGRMFTTSGSKLLYSEPGDFTYWPQTNFIEVNNPIVTMKSISVGIIVFTYSEIFLLSGTDSTDFNLTLISDSIGCLNKHSADSSGRLVYFVNNHKQLVYTNGASVAQLLPNKLDKFPGVSSIAISNNYLYVGAEVIYKIGLEDSSITQFSSNHVYPHIISYLDSVYYNDYKPDTTEHDTQIYKLEGSTSYADGKWLSPRYIGGSHGDLKYYKRVKLIYEGLTDLSEALITCTVRINNVSVGTWTFKSDEIKLYVEEFTLPIKTGYDIQFEIDLPNSRLLELHYSEETR